MEEIQNLTIEGRNAVLEAFRSGKTIDKLFLLDGCVDGPIKTIHREAKKHDTIISYVTSGCHSICGSLYVCNGRRYAAKSKGCRRGSVFDFPG